MLKEQIFIGNVSCWKDKCACAHNLKQMFKSDGEFRATVSFPFISAAHHEFQCVCVSVCVRNEWYPLPILLILIPMQ